MSRPRLVILMYHALVKQHEPYMAAVHVEVARFAEQMAWLAASGCQVLPLHAVPALLQQPAASDRPGVVLTFDDGYESLYTHARPILQRYGFEATLFLTTGAVGEPSYASQPELVRSAPRGDRPLSWAEVRALAAAGWQIESHGCTHRPLARLGTEEVVVELTHSPAAIAHELGRAPTFYAYPYGSYDRRTLRALTSSGYRAGLSVHTGPVRPTSDFRRLPRLEVTAGCDLPTFQRLVTTGYTSRVAQYRAWLRNALYKLPMAKDIVQKVKPLGRA